MTQLWLREVGAEYAMHKPPKGEIWPDTRPVKFSLHPSKLPGGMSLCYSGPHDVKWELERLDGAEIRMSVDGHPKKYLDEVALIWKVHETHRTHCSRCWKKIEGSQWFLGADIGGHQTFTCPANSEFDDRFPRDR